MSPPCSITRQFMPISPRPPRATTRTLAASGPDGPGSPEEARQLFDPVSLRSSFTFNGIGDPGPIFEKSECTYSLRFLAARRSNPSHDRFRGGSCMHFAGLLGLSPG